MQVVEVIPFKDFKGQLQQMKKLTKEQRCNVEVLSNCLYIEIPESNKRRKKHAKKSFRKKSRPSKQCRICNHS